MVNFRIVENAPPTYVEKYDEFVELYNDKSITVQEILKKLGWSTNVLDQAKEKALANNDIKLRKPYNCRGKKIKEPPKYYSYSKNSGKFAVKKHVYNESSGKSVLVYFGSYSSEEVVVRVVEELKKVDWDKDELDGIVLRLKEEFNLNDL